ncbi:MAG: alkylhydroperoxidase [Bacteroidetes bacterium]|nr:alkylhydroperoxidase [Bacteroidota bacterium]
MTWIKTISYEKAKGKLLNLYDRIKGPENNVDNVMIAHSLRQHTMEGHLALYKNVLHHPNNKIPNWFLEAAGVYTSILNSCDYCIEHHFAGMSRLLKNDKHAKKIRSALETQNLAKIFNAKECIALYYVKMLTIYPTNITENDLDKLRSAGWDDGEILELNQVTSYFNYVNRMVLGLGINTDGDILGLSPNDSEDLNDLQHK